MDAEKARSLRVQKRLEEKLNLKGNEKLDDFDDDQRGTKQVLRELEKQYRNEEKEVGQNDLDKMEYFGNRIEPFHMKDDRETGTIHEDGFVEISKTKERQTRDAWLDSIDEIEDPKSKLAKRPAKDDLEDDDDDFDAKSDQLEPKEKYHLTKELYNLLHPGETPNQALSRLRPAQAKPQKKTQKNVRKKQLKTEENSEQHNLAEGNNNNKEGEIAENKEDEEKKKAFDRLVEICDSLCGNGYMEVYNDTRERVQNRFMRFEDELIKHDLEDEGKIEDMNPDHNVIEQ